MSNNDSVVEDIPYKGRGDKGAYDQPFLYADRFAVCRNAPARAWDVALAAGPVGDDELYVEYKIPQEVVHAIICAMRRRGVDLNKITPPDEIARASSP